MRIKEGHRRTGALVFANFGWWGAMGLLGVHIGLGGAPPVGDSPPWLGLVIVTLIGVGIAGGTALSRMRLADTIKRALEVGADVAATGAKERQQQIISLLNAELKDRKANNNHD